MSRRWLALGVLLVAGCAAPGAVYTPIVDRPGPTYAQDLAECRQYAQQVIGPGGGAAAGAAVGFGLGYLMCRAMGGRDCSSVGRGVAVAGAAQGAAVGAVNEVEIVRRCMVGRGHRVLN